MRRKLLHLGLTGAGLFLAFIGGAQPVITSQPTNQSGFYGGNVTFSVMVTGVGPFTYRWQFNGTNLPSTNVITTVAGSPNQNSGFSGDGGLATNANLHGPSGVAVDQLGNIFISDAGNNRIRKVDTNGIIITVAGNGNNGFSDDGGAATNAQMASVGYAVNGIALDGLGNFYFSDIGNYLIRKVDTNGIITTFAGGGSGTGGRHNNGLLATNASLSSPEGIALDAFGNFFIADYGDNTVYKVDTNDIITIVAGGHGLNSSGNGGAATNASLELPMGVSVDALGNLFIADVDEYAIRKVDTNGIITAFAPGAAMLNRPSKAIPDAFGNLYICDTYNDIIRKVDTNGLATTVAGKIGGGIGYSGEGGAATNAVLDYPFDIAFDSFGNLFIADFGLNSIQKVNLSGSPNLQLNNLTTNKAGNYQVIITSPSGSVTSAIVVLTLFLPPKNFTAQNLGTGLQLQLTGTPNYPYILQSATNLTPPIIWKSIYTNSADTNGNWQFTTSLNGGQKFYRAVGQ